MLTDSKPRMFEEVLHALIEVECERSNVFINRTVEGQVARAKRLSAGSISKLKRR